MEIINQKKLFVLDMDGTIYLDNRMLEGALDFIGALKNNHKQFLFFTNNASKTPEYYINKLKALGCSIGRENIMTAGDVTIKYLKEKQKGKSVYLLGTELLTESFARSGINLVGESPDIVVVSFDLGMTYEKVSKACSFIREGAMFIATHMDYNCPTETGFIPDCGSICAMITASTGVKPKYLGKPFSETIEMIMSRTGRNKDEMAIIGDRLYTDMAMGVNNGVTSILVLSGETGQEDLAVSAVKPDFVFRSIKEIVNIIGNKP